MRVIKIVENSTVAQWELNEIEKILTIEGVEIVLDDFITDYHNVITITNDNGTAILGNEGKQGYIADVEIPPQEYETIEVETIGNEEKTEEKYPLPLNLDAVVLKLWPFGEGVINNSEMEEQGDF